MVDGAGPPSLKLRRGPPYVQRRNIRLLQSVF